MSLVETALSFINRINQRDADKVAELMTEHNVFIDSLGQMVRARRASSGPIPWPTPAASTRAC